MRILMAILTLALTTTVWAEEPAATPTASTKTCVFSYKPDSVKVFATGYKFTEKKGAKGEFKDIKVDASKTAKSAEELILSTSIDIDTAKFDTGDAGRDNNLREGFFKKMKGPHIVGKVVSYNSGILKVKTTMNGVSKMLAFNDKIEGNKYKASTDFDMVDLFKMKKPLESLSKVCLQQHKGADGKSKTWSQVSLALEGEIMNSCEAAPAAPGTADGH